MWQRRRRSSRPCQTHIRKAPSCFDWKRDALGYEGCRTTAFFGQLIKSLLSMSITV